VNRWFSDILELDCRLVEIAPDAFRAVDANFAVSDDDEVSFADGFPYLLIGASSLADLNTRLATPVPMNRFRPNIVMSGADAFAEDEWRRIRIGETTFHVVKPCARCVLTTVDQVSGEKTGAEPLRTLATYRTVNGKVMFGQNLIAENVGDEIRVGDRVTVLE
jgi:hypothetical protein